MNWKQRYSHRSEPRFDRNNPNELKDHLVLDHGWTFDDIDGLHEFVQYHPDAQQEYRGKNSPAVFELVHNEEHGLSGITKDHSHEM